MGNKLTDTFLELSAILSLQTAKKRPPNSGMTTLLPLYIDYIPDEGDSSGAAGGDGRDAASDDLEMDLDNLDDEGLLED